LQRRRARAEPPGARHLAVLDAVHHDRRTERERTRCDQARPVRRLRAEDVVRPAGAGELMPMSDAPVRSLGSIFIDAGAYADPERWHHAARRIRAEAPILKVSEPGYPEFWAVTKHADVMEVERHPEVFTNAPVPVLGPKASLE